MKQYVEVVLQLFKKEEGAFCQGELGKLAQREFIM